jgi:hypothetical protein
LLFSHLRSHLFIVNMRSESAVIPNNMLRNEEAMVLCRI